MPPAPSAGIALVTGGARRVGRAISLELARSGMAVAVHHNRSAAEAAEVVAAIEALGGRAVAIEADLTDHAALGRVVPECHARIGPVGVLVNNASLFHFDDISSLTPDVWEQHLAINLSAAVFLAKAIAEALPDNMDGNVINIVDQRVLRPTPLFLSYAVSKAALWESTKMLAQALAPRLRVNAIAPGPALRSIHQSEAQFARQCAATPLEKGTSPEEIARAVRFILTSPALTGAIIPIDGGQHLAWQTPDVVGTEAIEAKSSPASRASTASATETAHTRGRLRHLYIEGLTVSTIIGIHPHEKSEPQRIIIDATVAVIETGTPGSDRFDEVLDYDRIAGELRAIAKAGGVLLLETLAERMAAACLADPRAVSVRLRLRKPDIVADCTSVGIEIERLRTAR